MKRNVASQVIGAQLNSKTDGTAVTSGTTTVYVTGDGGTQAAGSVGSGACTHEGQGFWTYAPAQAETDYAHVAFTFVNSSAVTATVQLYPSFPQTGDAFTRIGAPVGASISADIAGVQSDTDNIQTRLPTSLVSGRIDASVGAMASGVLTATAIAADAITDAKVASDVTIASVTGSVGSVTGAVGSVTGAVGSVTGNVGGNVTGSVGSVATGGIAAASFAAGAIDAAAIATDALGALELAAGAASEIATAVRTELTTELGRIDAAVSTRATQASVDTIDDFVDTEVAAIKAKTDQLTFTTANRVDSQVFGMQAGTVTAAAVATDAIDADAIAADAVTEIQSGLSTLNAAGVRSAVGLASANLDTQLDALPTNAELSTALAFADDAVLAQVALVKAVTDKVDDTLEDDAGTYRFTANALEQAPTGGSAPSAADIADAVWDETLAGHLTAGSTGNALNAAGSAGDPWATALPGAYGSGSAGKIIGDNINATISSRASQASVDTVAGYVDTEVAAIKTKTDFLPSATAGAAGGLFIAGANAATTVNLTGNLTGNVSGSVGSVTADVGITQAGADKAWNTAARTLTAGTNIVLAKGTGVTGFNDLSAAQVNAEADTALADVGVTTTVTGRIDAAISTRLATAGYTAPDNADILAIKAKTDNLPSDPADQSLLIAATDAIVTAIADKTGYRLSATGVNDILRTALTEGYAADGAAMTLEQAVHMVWSMLCGKEIVGTTLTTRKLDGSTAAMTFTLDDGSAPTSQARAT